MDIDFEAYLCDIPKLHSWDGGKTWNTGGFGEAHLRAFYEMAGESGGPKASLLETGAGNSTLAFLYARPKRLVTIAPDETIFERIHDVCIRNRVDTAPLEQHVDRSEWVLPQLAQKNTHFDLALIDGGHGWPTVFVDFCYVYAMLRKDGILIIDDLQLHSIKELGRLLVSDQERFSVLRDLGKSLALLKRRDEQFLPDWIDLPYIVRRSESYTKWSNPFSLADDASGP